MNSVPKDDLPEGWILCESKSIPGKKYYFHKRSGKSLWTRPQQEDKSDKCKKKFKEKCNQVKDKNTEPEPKSLKRKSDDGPEEGPSKRQTLDNDKNVPEKINNSIKPINRQCRPPTTNDTDTKQNTRNVGKRLDVEQIPTQGNTPAKKHISYSSWVAEHGQDRTPKPGNVANNRMAVLRARLSEEAEKSTISHPPTTTPKPTRISPKHTDAGYSKNNTKPELKSPNLNESRYSTTNHSPSNDSMQIILSPSQFLAANKILSSMKAQLPEEYTNKMKAKDTFADIEEGIYNQTPEFPPTKHPSTPPQFSEASKLVSAIKSRLEYKSNKDTDIKAYSSANERLQVLRTSLSMEANLESKDQSTDFTMNSREPAVSMKRKHSDELMEVEEVKPIKTTKCDSETLQYLRDNMGSINDLVLVVDTNMFIHELGVIRNVIISHIKGYSSRPTLLVPWRVINELDRLKDNNNGNGAICKRAKAAMDYLYQSLPENDRIKGQSLRDANSHIYPCELPDDEILNCCLQQAERGKAVILLTNDKNLGNKAVINSIRSIDVTELRLLMDSKAHGSSDPELQSSMKYYENCIYQLLANILENEMRAKYNNLWQHVLLKAPPWSLDDVLACLLKHWIAVFNEVFPRIEHLMQELKSVFGRIEDKGPKCLTQSDVSNFRELALEVARKCQIIPEYMELAKSTVDRLKRNDQACPEEDGAMPVVEAFENIWTVFSSYCAKLSTMLGITHSVDDKLVGADTLQSLRERWPAFSKQIYAFTSAVRGALSVHSVNEEKLNEHIVNLDNAFRDTLMLVNIENHVNRNNIRLFYSNCKNMLQEAVLKFTELTELLNDCSRMIDIE